jgi:hypothetical protein
VKFWLLSPTRNQVLRTHEMFCNSRVAITNTGQQNHVPNCAAVCVVLVARGREQCMDKCTKCEVGMCMCLVSRNITLKWICKGPNCEYCVSR